LGAFVLLLALKLLASEFFLNIVDFTISFLPMIVIVAMVAWGYFRHRGRREIILETLGLLLITLLFYVLYSPDSWYPVIEALGSFGNLLELDNFFLLAAYFGIIYLAGAITYIAYERYKNNDNVNSLAHKLIYRTFITFFILFAFSALAYPGAYSPITGFLTDTFTPANNIQDQSNILTRLHKAITKTGSNLTDSITKSNSDLATTLEDTKTKLDESITQTNKDLKTNLETQLAAGTFTVAGPLVVQNTSTTQDIVPESGSNYDLGTASKNWNNLYVHSLHGASAVVVGTSGSSHGVNASDDLVVSGSAEVKGTLYVDKLLDVANNKIVNVASPTSDNDATNKTYVDNLVGVAAFIQRSGSTMSPVNSGDSLDMGSGSVYANTGNFTTLNTATLNTVSATSTGTFTVATLSGTTGSFTNLTVSSSPTSNTSAANKAYVDTQIATKDTFIELTDSPGSYSGSSGKFVKSNGSSLDFANLTAADILSGNLDIARLPNGGSWDLSSNLNIDSNTLYVNRSDNRVGIVTNSPNEALEVSGNIRTSGVYKIGTQQVLSLGAGSLTGNLVVGDGGSALTGAGQNNTAIGIGAFTNNATGAANTILGVSAGKGVLTNSYSNNTFIGYQTGYSTTTGGNNFFGGYQAGYYNTTGTNNVFLGIIGNLCGYFLWII